MSDLLDVALGLEGSPYSLPDDPSQRQILKEALLRAADLERRCLRVRHTLAESTERLRRASRTSEIFESNAIEGKQVTLRETQQILEERNMWNADQALAAYTIRKAFQGEAKVQDVVGLAAARILVDQYIADRSRSLTEVDLREFHGLILNGDTSAGRYKQLSQSHSRLGAHTHSSRGRPRLDAQPGDLDEKFRQLSHLEERYGSCMANAYPSI